LLGSVVIDAIEAAEMTSTDHERADVLTLVSLDQVTAAILV